MMALLNLGRVENGSRRQTRRIEQQSVKMASVFTKYLSDYAPSEFNLFREWFQQHMAFDFHHSQGLKVLDIGAFMGKMWTNPLLEKTQIEMIDQSLLSVNIIKPNVLSEGDNISIKRMDYTALAYENYTFDRVISKSSFQFQPVETQIKFLKEANRVLKSSGVHYVLENDQSLMGDLYRLIVEFHKEINHENKFLNFYEDYLIDIHQQLNDLYDEVEVMEYEANHLIYDVKQCMALFLAYEDQNYMNYIVKRHLGKRFHEFLEMKIKISGPLVLKRNYRLFKAKHKKTALKLIVH